jgi:phage baseplate assembly protein W
MKTAEEFVSKWSNWWITNNNKNVLNRAFENELKEIIEQAQKEAYNQAIDDAVMNAEAKVEVWYDFDARAYQRGDVIVDRNSILKLKK